MLTSEQTRRLPGTLAIAGGVALALALLGVWLEVPAQIVLRAQIGAAAAGAFIGLFPEARLRWFVLVMIAVNSLFSVVMQ